MTDADAATMPRGNSSVVTPREDARGPRWRTAIYPVLFAAYPVLFLWSQNLSEAEPGEVLPPLLITMAGAALLTIILGLILRDIRKAALILTPLIIGLLGYGHATRLSRAFDLPAVVQQAAWAAAVVAAIVLAFRLSGRNLDRLGTALTRIAAILIVITLVQIVPYQLTTTSSTSTNQSARGPGDDDRRPEAGRLLVHLRPVWIRPRARPAVRHRQRPHAMASRAGVHRPRQCPPELREDEPVGGDDEPDDAHP